MAWAFAKIGFVDIPLFNAISAESIRRCTEFNTQDLANIAWAFANIQLRDETLMDAISSEARRKISDFENTDFSSTAWAFSALGVEHSPLRDAISREVLKKLDSLGPQQMGTLVDLGLNCQEAIETRLQDEILSFLRRFPRSLEGFRRGEYQQLVDEFEIDNFGSAGDRFLLGQLEIHAASEEFKQKAVSLCAKYREEHKAGRWRSDGLLHQRVVSWAQYEFTWPGQKNRLIGTRFQQNGYQGTPRKKNWLCATTLPLNLMVDRRLCSEFQLYSAVCDEILAAGGPLAEERPAHAVQGFLRLYVPSALCASCVGATAQFRLLLPAIAFEVVVGDELSPQ